MYKAATPFLSVLLTLFLSISSPAFSQNYYVDSVNGNDSNLTGTLPDSNAQGDGPWKTITKVNSRTFSPGDSVLFRCGETWRETLTINSAGNAGSPISFASYGNCDGSNKPQIKASQTISGWNVYSGNIYVANVNFAVKQLFVDGQYMRLAQYPKSGYLIIDSDSKDAGGSPAKNFLVDSDLNAIAGRDIVGAGIHIRTINWRVEDRTVSAFDPSINKLSWSSSTSYAIYKDYGYYLDNKLWMLSQTGEWFYDAAQGKVYAWLPDSADPNTHSIEGSQDGFGIRVLQGYVTIDGLSVKHAATDGITFSAAPNFIGKNLEVTDSGQRGVVILGSIGGSLQNSSVRNSVNEGIEIQNSYGTSITGNRVENSGTVGSPKNSLAAIHSQYSEGVTIQGNIVFNAGYIGIRFVKDSTIRNNIVENVCIVLDDCGGIYSWAYTNSKDTLAGSLNSTVSSNIVIGSIGNTQGRPAGNTGSVGFYLDDYTNGLQVLNNTAVNTDAGIFLHNAYNNNVQGNVTYGNRQSELSLSENGGVSAGVTQRNNITNNTFFPVVHTESVKIYSAFSEIILSGANRNNFDMNRYSGMYSDTLIGDVFPSSQLSFTLPQWQQAKSEDANSTSFDLFRIALYEAHTIPPNFINNSTFDMGIGGWTVWSSTNDAVIAPQNSCYTGGCLKFSAGSTPSLTYGSNFSIYAGKTYLVRADLRGIQAGQTVSMWVREGGPASYYGLGLYRVFTVGPNWDTYTFVFKATGSDILGVSPNQWGARLDFEITPGQQLYIDNVVIEEASAVFNDPSDNSAILINRSSTTAAMDCPIDAVHTPAMCPDYVYFDNGLAVTWPVNVPPMSSRIVVWTKNPFLDTDHDGIADINDQCPNTIPGANVDEHGCSFFQQHPADLWVTITGSPNPTLINGIVTYTVSITNAGPSPAGGINLSGLTGCTLPATTLASAANMGCTATVTATTVGTLTQTVNVTGNELDPNTANNSASATTNVQGLLTVTPSGIGKGTVTSAPAGIICGGTCSAPYDANTSVMLTATAANDSVFGSWSGCDSVAGTGCTVGMNANRSVTATFNGLPDLVISTVSGPTAAIRGANITVNATTANTGIAAAAVSTTALYLSTDATITSSDLSLSTVSIGSLAAGATSPNSVSVTLPSTLVTGAYYLGAIADAAGAVVEGNATATGESNNAKTGNVIQISGVPAAPSNLTATVNSRSKITLNWTDNAIDESGFKIERSIDGTTFRQITTPDANVKTYTSSGLSANTVYYYRIRAFNNRGNSTFSNTVSARTNP